MSGGDPAMHGSNQKTSPWGIPNIKKPPGVLPRLLRHAELFRLAPTTSHAIIRPNRRPFRASGTRTAIGFSTAPHVFEPEVVSRPKIDNHKAIDISSRDIG